MFRSSDGKSNFNPSLLDQSPADISSPQILDTWPYVFQTYGFILYEERNVSKNLIIRHLPIYNWPAARKTNRPLLNLDRSWSTSPRLSSSIIALPTRNFTLIFLTFPPPINVSRLRSNRLATLRQRHHPREVRGRVVWLFPSRDTRFQTLLSLCLMRKTEISAPDCAPNPLVPSYATPRGP